MSGQYLQIYNFSKLECVERFGEKSPTYNPEWFSTVNVQHAVKKHRSKYKK